MADPEGDATQAAVAESPGPSERGLDIREGRLTFDSAAQELRFTIRVTDLSARTAGREHGRVLPLLLHPGRATAGCPPSPTATPASDVFSLSRYDAGTASTTAASGWPAPSTRPRAAWWCGSRFSAYKAFAGVEVAPGDLFSVGQVLGQRDTTTATLTADTAAGTCGYTAPAATTPAPGSSPTATATASTEPDASPATDPTVTLARRPRHQQLGEPQPGWLRHQPVGQQQRVVVRRPWWQLTGLERDDRPVVHHVGGGRHVLPVARADDRHAVRRGR